MCAFSVRYSASAGVNAGEEISPRSVPQMSFLQETKPNIHCLDFVTCIRQGHAAAFHCICSKPGAALMKLASKTSKHSLLMKISKMQLKTSPSIRSLYFPVLQLTEQGKLWPMRKTSGKATREVDPGGCRGQAGAQGRGKAGARAEAGRGRGRGHCCPGRGAGSRRVGEGKELLPSTTGKKSVSCLLYLLFISLMRLFPGSLITIIETIPFVTLFTAWKRKSLWKGKAENTSRQQKSGVSNQPEQRHETSGTWP